MSAQRHVGNALPLTPAEFAILLVLADHDRHGYTILQEVTVVAQGTVRIGPTTLYRSIKRLMEQGLILETDQRPDPALDDERRRYYRLTSFGRQVALAEAERLDQALAIARAKLHYNTPSPVTGIV